MYETLITGISANGQIRGHLVVVYEVVDRWAQLSSCADVPAKNCEQGYT
jgi:hypothetical protein